MSGSQNMSGSKKISGSQNISKEFEETLSDLYPCLLHHQQLPENKIQINNEINTLTLSLTGMMESLTPAVCVQLAMLLCIDTSIIMVSLSPSLLSATISMLPLLIKPFRMGFSCTKQVKIDFLEFLPGDTYKLFH
jgi:hypothetical protein